MQIPVKSVEVFMDISLSENYEKHKSLLFWNVFVFHLLHV